MSFLSETLGTQPTAPTNNYSGSFLNGIQESTAPIPSPYQAPQPQPSLLDNVIGGAKTIYNDAKNALFAPATPPITTGTFSTKTPSVGGDIALTALNSYANTLKGFSNSLDTMSTTMNDHHSSLLQKGLSVGEAGVGALQAFFAPISAAAVGAENIPVLGGVAHAINNVFSLVGSASADVGEGALQAIPFIPQSAKDKATPLVREIFALGGQIAVGAKGGDVWDALTSKTKAFVDTINSGIDVAKTTVENGAGQLPKDITPTGESVTQPVPFANKYETPSTIQMGVKPKDTLPVAEYTPVSKGGFLDTGNKPTEVPVAPESAHTAPITPKVENIPPEVPASPQQIGMQKVVPLNEPAPKEVTPQKTGEITKAAKDINATLVKQGYDALSPELQSKYTPESYKAELVKSKDLASTNYEDAVARATGKKPLGNHEGQILFNEVERIATKNGDYQTLLDLASSPLGKKLSQAGQTLGAAGFNDNPNSPVEAIRSVQEARTKALEKKGVDIKQETTKETASIKNEVAKAVKESLPKWDSFIQSITCGY